MKAECLQPAGSFKVRGASNALLAAEHPPDFVYTASAGNMALALAWAGSKLGSQVAAVVPDTAPEAKTRRIVDLGAIVHPVPFDEWWQAMVDGFHPAFSDKHFVHPFHDPLVVAGSATIGVEIVEQSPDVDAVVVPFGGGGLALGIARGLRAAGCSAPVYAAEVETAAPLSIALAAGRSVEPDRRSSFVDGIGGRAVFPTILEHARNELAGSIVVDLAQTAEAMRLCAAQTKLLLEGAGAAALAAALTLPERHRQIVAIGSGGNIDLHVAGRILAGANV